MIMSAEFPAWRRAGFLRHRALILVAAAGAVVEAGILTLLGPAARPVAPQVTALPSVAAYHDLRWLFADGQSWQEFAAIVLAVLLARAALDATLLRFAWPRPAASHSEGRGDRDGEPAVSSGAVLSSGAAVPSELALSFRTAPSSGLAPPRWGRAFWSCLALTAVCWVLLSPAVTLAFGAAVLPFSWPMIGALPIMLSVVLALSHGGTVMAWWRRLPPARAAGWVLSSFAVLSAGGGVIAHLNVAGALGVAALTGLFNARAWYGMAALAARMPPRHVSWAPARVLLAIPVAPIACLVTLALVVGAARLLFTGTVKLVHHPPVAVSVASAAVSMDNGTPALQADNSKKRPGAVLVVEGWGTWCCDAADGLGAVLQATGPQGAARQGTTVVRQFSYRGLDASGNPLRSGPDDDDLPLPQLGDKIAAQVLYLHRVTHGPVSIVAESEGTLGVYAMLARHPGLPVGSIVLLSPIVAPGQLSFPGAGPGVDAVPPAALDELNHLIGTMSPYGSAGAQQLLASVSEFGARFFSGVQRATTVRWLAVIPLADALTLPACGLPPGVLVVPAFHGGLLGDPDVLPVVARFIDGSTPPSGGVDQGRLRAAAEVITDAAAAWRMPDMSTACP
jgi:hypothetical protein